MCIRDSSAALRQLQYFWPQAVGGPPPGLVNHKARLITEAGQAMRLSTDRATVRDVAAEIEWAKAVSYTHLDVYKRQVATGATPGTAAAAMAASNSGVVLTPSTLPPEPSAGAVHTARVGVRGRVYSGAVISSQDPATPPAPPLGPDDLPFAGRPFDRDAVEREHRDLSLIHI